MDFPETEPDRAAPIVPQNVGVTVNKANSGYTVADLSDLPPSLGLEAAALLLGIGRTNAYYLVQRGEFPVPVLRISRRYRISTHAVLHLLGVELTTAGRPSLPDQ